MNLRYHCIGGMLCRSLLVMLPPNKEEMPTLQEKCIDMLYALPCSEGRALCMLYISCGCEV